MSDSLFVSMIERGPLTKRESDVLVKLCRGMTRKEIAGCLFRSNAVVSRHVESIAFKLKAHSTAEIVAKAVARGLVSIRQKAA